jgi:fused signal recognition particle receptor
MTNDSMPPVRVSSPVSLSHSSTESQDSPTPPKTSEKEGVKKGFFSRLFGRSKTLEAPATPSDITPRMGESDETALVQETESPLEQEALKQEDRQKQYEREKNVQEIATSLETPLDLALDTPALESPVLMADVVKNATSSSFEKKQTEKKSTEKLSWWQRLTTGLRKTSSTLSLRLSSLLFQRKLDADTLEELEDILIQADLGLPTAARITKIIREGRFEKTISAEDVKAIMAQEIETILEPVAVPFSIVREQHPFVILMVGVNGAGKTTSIGKLAHLFHAQGLKVMLAAGDTFRAAAVEQLKVWGQRTHARVVARPQGADASGLVYEAYQEAVEQKMDVLLIDTAGRLQNKAGLMAELEKIVRVLKKANSNAPHACLLVLDATVGQNALSQVELFSKTAGVTGLIMTKLDGTARGGILVALAQKFKLPVHFLGVGETLEDLEPFTARDFARAIAGLDEG